MCPVAEILTGWGVFGNKGCGGLPLSELVVAMVFELGQYERCKGCFRGLLKFGIDALRALRFAARAAKQRVSSARGFIAGARTRSHANFSRRMLPARCEN